MGPQYKYESPAKLTTMLSDVITKLTALYEKHGDVPCTVLCYGRTVGFDEEYDLDPDLVVENGKLLFA